MKRRHEIDMTSGPLLGKIFAFALPLLTTNILQLLYNAADTVIIGQFDGSAALAAVGSTAALINLVTNVMIGLATGTSVIVAQHKGAGEDADVSRTVHTSILLSILGGILVSVIGECVSRPMLVMMGTPEHLLADALLYVRIYFAGIPFMMLVNFGASILRAVGDTRRPLYFLSISGLLNVRLNLLFVVVFDMGVSGVAVATVISQAVAALLITLSLCHADGSYRLIFRQLHIYGDKLIEILKIGLPAGIQGSLFSISNVIIQSSINSFGQVAMAAHTAAVSLEGFMNAAVNSVADAATSFVGQNVGAGKPKRVKKVTLVCSVANIVISVVMGTVIMIFARQLLGIYNKEPEVIELGLNRLYVIGATYFTFGLMQVFAASLRGMGHSLSPMIISILGICGLRILYIYTVFPLVPTLMGLYISYPASWLAAWLGNMVWYFIISRKMLAQHDKAAAA